MRRRIARSPFRLLAVSLLGLTGCAVPDFVADGPFARSLKEFQRIEVRPVQVALSTAPSGEQLRWAKQFAGDFRASILHRLHHRAILDAPEGAVLVLEGRISKYEWGITPGSENSPSRAESRIEFQVTFRDESGAKLGSGSVLATGTGSMPRFALENAEKGVVSSVYKFVRKAVGRHEENEYREDPEPQVSPTP